MTNAELKSYFNLLYNNINNNAAPGLKDKEISMFLTKAQDEVIKNHILTNNTYQMGVNQMSKRDNELDSLIKVYATTTFSTQNVPRLHPHSVTCVCNVNPLVILSETANDKLDVVELSYIQFNKFMAGIYKHPKKNQCWKLRHDSVIELVMPVSINTLTKYVMVYVKKPADIDVNGSTIEVPETLHQEIVQRAVELAKAAYMSESVSIQTQMGQRSE